MKGYGNIDLSAFFGIEVRQIDGQDCLFIPLRFNQSVRFIKGRPILLFTVDQLKRYDGQGYNHIIIPYLPQSVVKYTPEADYMKMSQPIGRMRLIFEKKKSPQEPQNTSPAISSAQLATNPVTDDIIPL